MNYKKLLLCAAIVPMLASCGKQQNTGLNFNDGDTFTFLASGENIKEGKPSVFSFLQDEGFTESFLAVRTKKDVFNSIIDQCGSIVIKQYNSELNKYEFTYGKNSFGETEGTIGKDGSFSNDEGENDYCNWGLGSCTYNHDDTYTNYSSTAVFKKFDLNAMKVYFTYKVTKQDAGAEKQTFADELAINIEKAQ